MQVLGETSGPRPWPGTVRKDVTLGGTLERLVRTTEAAGVARGVVSAGARPLARPPEQSDPTGAGSPLACRLCSPSPRQREKWQLPACSDKEAGTAWRRRRGAEALLSQWSRDSSNSRKTTHAGQMTG